MSKALCIIPARGGSKRIPGKNIKDFLGKPIIAYSIETALNSGVFHEVMVSTDCEEIKKVSQSFGAAVPFLRSERASDDFASTLDVVKEVLDCYSRLELQFESICVLYPTAPLAQVNHLKKGFKLLDEYNAVMPVSEFSYPVLRALTLNHGVANYKWIEFSVSRSQDLQKLYHDAGQWYWLKETSIKNNTTFPEKTYGMILNPNEVQDIDTFDDWSLAELKYLRMNGSLRHLISKDSKFE